VQWCMAQCQYTFCYLIYLDEGIVVQFFELNVQLEEFGSFDVPVEAAGIDIEELVVGQQDIEFVGQLFCFYGIQAYLVLFCSSFLCSNNSSVSIWYKKEVPR
jgi:hypothetical protein